jgi:hypothetical protein
MPTDIISTALYIVIDNIVFDDPIEMNLDFRDGSVEHRAISQKTAK